VTSTSGGAFFYFVTEKILWHVFCSATMNKIFSYGKEIFNCRPGKEFKEGKLKSSSGDKVIKRDQAVAIAISEAKEAHLKVPSKRSAGSKKKKAKL
jgi:hypothetical protein